MEQTGLVKFDAAIHAIAKAKSVDEVKDIRDKAEAARVYAKQAGISLKGQNMLAEIKIRAERKAGQILSTMPGKGSRGGDRKSTDTMSVETLGDLGISEKQSSRWQAEATVPDETFEAHVEKTNKAGKELTSAGVQALAKQNAREQQKAVSKAIGARKANKTKRYKVFCVDFREMHDDFDNIDHIITDQPYGKDAIPLYEPLATFAAKALKPGGSLIVMCGQSYLPEIYRLMDVDGLNYYWTCAYMLPGGPTPLKQKNVNCSWKPLLWYVKGKCTQATIGDVIISPKPDKTKHPWGQSLGGMRDIVRRFTKEGETILDPFMGAGTTGKAAIVEKRHFIGIDIETDWVNVSKDRFNDDSEKG